MLRTRLTDLCSPRRRERLAAGLERVVAQADAPPALTAAAPIARDDVRGARPLILDVARRLRSSATVDPRGVLLVQRLLCDPASPLAPHGEDVSLRRALLEANAALTPP